MYKVEIDPRGLERKLKKLDAKALSHAAVNAVNDAAKKLQIELQHDVRQRFTIRNEFTVRQAAIIKPFASVAQNRPFSEIGVGQRSRLFLSQYEKGGPRSAVAGGAKAAMPAIKGPARPTFRSKVPQAYRYRALGLRRKKQQRQGKLRTFAISEVGVFQRTGPSKGNVRAVYLFTRDQQLPDRMSFTEIAAKYAPRFLRQEFERQISRAIARANR